MERFIEGSRRQVVAKQFIHLLDHARRQLDLVDADRRAEASTRAPFGPLGVEPDEDRRGLPSRGVGAQPPRAARRRCLALVMGRRRFF